MPTIDREGSYRFFFNSKEESRMHVHVESSDGAAKFWLEPIITVAVCYQYSSKELRRIETIVEAHHDEFVAAWRRYLGG